MWTATIQFLFISARGTYGFPQWFHKSALQGEEAMEEQPWPLARSGAREQRDNPGEGGEQSGAVAFEIPAWAEAEAQEGMTNESSFL